MEEGSDFVDVWIKIKEVTNEDQKYIRQFQSTFTFS